MVLSYLNANLFKRSHIADWNKRKPTKLTFQFSTRLFVLILKLHATNILAYYVTAEFTMGLVLNNREEQSVPKI